MHQLHPLSCQIAHSAVLWRQDGSCGQNTQSQQMRKVMRIGFVTTVIPPPTLAAGGRLDYF